MAALVSSRGPLLQWRGLAKPGVAFKSSAQVASVCRTTNAIIPRRLLTRTTSSVAAVDRSRCSATRNNAGLARRLQYPLLTSRLRQGARKGETTTRSLSTGCPFLSKGYHIKYSNRGNYHPRRAVMYIPASDERKLKKSAALKIDTVVFDLEDGVAMNQKEKARQSVHSAIQACRHADSLSAHSEHVVRVNGVESGLLHLDLAAVFRPGSHDQSHDHHGGSPDAIMLPKADSVEHIAELDLSLAYYRSPSLPPIPLFIIIESPTALLNLKDICQFASEKTTHLRLGVVVFGSDDFLARLGGVRTKDASEILYARQSTVCQSKAFGLDAVDMVDTNFKDLDSLRLQAEAAARMGYTGKQVIHPDQVPVVQGAFTPSPGMVEWARGLIEAFHQHQASGKGAFVYQGHMIDLPLLLQAENIVKLQDGIENS